MMMTKMKNTDYHVGDDDDHHHQHHHEHDKVSPCDDDREYVKIARALLAISFRSPARPWRDRTV